LLNTVGVPGQKNRRKLAKLQAQGFYRLLTGFEVCVSAKNRAAWKAASGALRQADRGNHYSICARKERGGIGSGAWKRRTG
jgi:hypothetical protein